jgi:hypothetical protein
MLFFDGALGLVLVGLWLFCIFDVITSDPADCRNLPKLVWLFIVIALFEIGSIAWLVAGRTWAGTSGSLPYKSNQGRFPEYERPGRHIATNPDDDEAFLRGLRERAEQQRRDQRARREQELREEQALLERRQREDGEPDGQA